MDMFKHISYYGLELYAFIRNIRYLNYLRLELTRDNSKSIPKSSVLFIPYEISKKTILKEGYIYKPENQPFPENNKIECIYINGIMTKKEKAEKETFNLGRHFKRNFTLLYNKTEGFFQDIFDCARMKINDRPDNNSESLRKYITYCYTHHNIKEFFIVGYSQGSIIATQAINNLHPKIKNRIQINLLTLGSAHDNLSPIDKGNALQICHKKDFVSRIGPIFYKKFKKLHGEILIKDKDTHNFVTYLETLKSLDSKEKKKLKFPYL